MKDILGHKSWTKDEIIEILSNRGSFTCCTLPHYRYDRVKSVCWELKKRGLIEKSGRTEQAVNYKPTALFRQWQQELAEGKTKLGVIKWQKARKAAEQENKEAA